MLLCKVIALVQRSGIVITVNETLTWPAYLRIIAGTDTGVQIAKRAGVPSSTVSRWLDGSANPRPQQVVKLARAYGAHPLQALIAAGYLEDGDVDLPVVAPRKLQLREFTELELAQEVLRRVEEGESGMLESPLDGNHPAMQ